MLIFFPNVVECFLGGVECEGRLMIVFVISERGLLCNGAGEGVVLVDNGDEVDNDKRDDAHAADDCDSDVDE
jgi:hypothetical protein